MTFLDIAGGIILLLVGGEMLIRGSVAFAERMGVSPLVIGLTLVGFGTSTPELVTSLDAAFMGAPGIAIGNVVGSNIANVLLIIGSAALISPILCDRKPVLREGMVMLAASALLAAAVIMGELGRTAGTILVSGLFVYIAWAWRNGLREAPIMEEEAEPDAQARTSIVLGFLFPMLLATAGLVIIVFGADMLVRGSIAVAQLAGISETIIGLTIVAIGTSLPELVASIMAARRGQSAMAVGNIIGSSIFNILGIAGITATVHPISIDAEIARFDIWVMCAASLALIVMALSGGRISRGEGAGLLGAYGLYLIVLLE